MMVSGSYINCVRYISPVPLLTLVMMHRLTLGVGRGSDYSSMAQTRL